MPPHPVGQEGTWPVATQLATNFAWADEHLAIFSAHHVRIQVGLLICCHQTACFQESTWPIMRWQSGLRCGSLQRSPHSLAGQIGEGGKEKRRVWDKGKEGGKKRGIGKR